MPESLKSRNLKLSLENTDSLQVSCDSHVVLAVLPGDRPRGGVLWIELGIARHVRLGRPSGRRGLLLVGEAGLLPFLERDPHVLGLLDAVGVTLPILPIAISEALADLLHDGVVIDDLPRSREAPD